MLARLRQAWSRVYRRSCLFAYQAGYRKGRLVGLNLPRHAR